MASTPAGLANIVLERGWLRPRTLTVFPLARVAEALAAVAGATVRGKVVPTTGDGLRSGRICLCLQPCRTTRINLPESEAS